VYPSTGTGFELSPRPLTAVELEFREDQLAGQSPVAQGVKCHVSCDMARYGNAAGHRSFQKEENNLFRLREETCYSRWPVGVFVSGTVVAPVEVMRTLALRDPLTLKEQS
jgi:hypothetical protein